MKSDKPRQPAAVMFGLGLRYSGADLFAGTVHWFCDTFFDEGTPIIGPVIIWPFRDHHRRPTAITSYRIRDQFGGRYGAVIVTGGDGIAHDPDAHAWRLECPDREDGDRETIGNNSRVSPPRSARTHPR